MPAPAYKSLRWIRQDWRYLTIMRDKDLFGNITERVSYSKRCGEKGNRTEGGKTRLCLPNKVIVSMLRSKKGTEELKKQIRKKLASKKKKVPYSPYINAKMKKFLSEDKFRDDPKLKRKKK